MKKTVNMLKNILLTTAVLLGVSFAQAWDGPDLAPPNGNTPAPINTSVIKQDKEGGLFIGDNQNGTNPAWASLAAGELVVRGDVSATHLYGIDLDIAGPVGDELNGFSVENGVANTDGGLIIETRVSDPTNPADGRMWLRTDL